MDERGRCPERVVVVGAGASGVLVAVRLAHGARRSDRRVDLTVVDPQPRAGGVAYTTDDPRHLLNVPAGGMSAHPDRPEHFVEWLRTHGDPGATAGTYAPRRTYRRYLVDAADQALRGARRQVTVHRRRARAVALRETEGSLAVRLEDGRSLAADAVVLASGRPGLELGWVPASLVDDPRFVVDPWAPGQLAVLAAGEGDVLLVGTGLTTVDVALTLVGRRVVHAVSRHGWLPRRHRPDLSTPLPLPPLARPVGLAELRRAVAEHVERSVRETGDWRPAVDGLRPETAALWRQLSDADKAEFLATDATRWNVHRHRMAPEVAAQLDDAVAAERLHVTSGRLVGVREHGDGRLAATLSDGRVLVVTHVVNCTGPGFDLSRCSDPLVTGMLRDGLARPGPVGLGLDTDECGRLVDRDGRVQPALWTLGPLRVGTLWETTAIPEIRAQADHLAGHLVGSAPPVQPQRDPRRRPRPVDAYGLPLTTTPDAATAYAQALGRLLRVESDVATPLEEALEADPTFAVAHAVQAVLAAEEGRAADADGALGLARRWVRARGDARERSFVGAVTELLQRPAAGGAAALLRHVTEHPRDALAVSLSVPTIAFNGATEIPEQAWALVEGLAPAYGEDWWYLGMLAFVRQEQQRYADAAALAERAVAEVAGSGHAVHALAHVHYETGEHEAGLAFLDPWTAQSGRTSAHRAHFSWHAALHELRLGRIDAVRRRFDEHLAPPGVTGVRALVDAASLLRRCQLAGAWRGRLPADQVLATVDEDLLLRPGTPFTAMHASVGLAAAGRVDDLARLEQHAGTLGGSVFPDVVRPLCRGMRAHVEGRLHDCAAELYPLLPRLGSLGGSAAQREVVEDTLLHALTAIGWTDEAIRVLQVKLDRRRDRSSRPTPTSTEP